MISRNRLLSAATLLVAFWFLYSWSARVQAQHLTRTLTGIVTDRQHEPLRGAIVEIHSEATGTVVSYITVQDGQYSFKRLEGDLDYTVWATWRGRRSGTKKLSLFDSHTDKVIDLEVAEAP